MSFFLTIFLIVFPLATAFALLVFRGARTRIFTVVGSSVLIAAGSLGLLTLNAQQNIIRLNLEASWVAITMLTVELALAVYIFYVGIRTKRYIASVLVAIQALLMVGFEWRFGHALHVEYTIFIDTFSVIMTLIIGVIGSLIAVYALGYMDSFHKHHRKECADRRPLFFFVLFVFLSAMFGIVLSNNLLWLYFFWEITTICSFVLIGYKQTPESQDNAFRALIYNLLGGLFFAAGIVMLYFSAQTVEMDKLMFMHKTSVLLPVAFLCFAGIIKSAQMPFSSWLLGAMVAPTPVSALLHSSTMVKAGVYLVVRFAGVLENTMVGLGIALIGATTFLLTSIIAITQSDAKKILAYSTIANLGLIIMCAGIGTYEAVWAAVLLIIFHAVAKCLLFLCVGVVEHKIHSRNVEDMSGLIITMPKLSIMLQIGMAGMFLAPFGMLISKWAVLKALVDYNPLLSIFLVFGSSATLFFWVKWMGRLICIVDEREDLEDGIRRSEWLALTSLSVMTIGVCAFFPAIAAILIEPFIQEMYHTTVSMGQGNLIIMAIMLAMVMLFPLSFLNYGKKVKVVDAYLAGANTPKGTAFYDSFGAAKDMHMKSFYLEKYLHETKIFRIGIAVCIALMIAATLVAMT
jgi:ech hydrogenase subunit A